ncbi:hypothetical protein [Methylobacterium fujisawaense]
MQTISVPYRCTDEARVSLTSLRRVCSAAVRTAYANARRDDGTALRQKELRDLVKARFAHLRIADAWLLHCATLEGMDLRRIRPDGSLVFGGRPQLERRRKGLIGRGAWREVRLRPMCSRGDATQHGNRHFRLSADAATCTLTVYGRPVVLQLAAMRGKAGEILRQVAGLAAAKAINLTFRLDATHLHVTLDPADLPAHPERLAPVPAVAGRALGIDLNPDWIGLSVVEVAPEADAGDLSSARLLDHRLIRLEVPPSAGAEQVRETLAAAAGQALALARAWGCGEVVLEKGLGKLRSAGRNRRLNRLLNHWARRVFGALLARRAGLAGLTVREVWGGYSTTIGNMAFPAPDACASAAEIARRGMAAARGIKDVLPSCTHEVVSGLWKDRGWPIAALPQRACGWADVHRGIKAAALGVRRPHPELAPDPGPLSASRRAGYAVRRLGLRRRPGLVARPLARPQARRDSPQNGGERLALSTLKSG